MAFKNHYGNLVQEKSQAHTRLMRDYDGANKDFDFIVIGSGMGGGILADDLADRLGGSKRILLLEAGSFIYPTHVYNVSRSPNFEVAKHFGVVNLKPQDTDSHYIAGEPQMGFGGRSIFWSGLIPDLQDWELEFFPDAVRQDLDGGGLLKQAGEKMNVSRSLGKSARKIRDHFRASALADDFDIEETPRALHQPYLNADGTPGTRFFVEPTGVFNTAELVLNQVGLTPGNDQKGSGLFVKLNAFVEGVHDVPHGWHEVRTTNTITGEQISYYAPKVIIAAGSTESPKLVNRSAVFQRLTDAVKRRVGTGLTDHPVSGESQAYVSSLKNHADPGLSREDHAKIIFYSKGKLDGDGNIRFPFNIELNVNHEYWHLRNNDPSAEPVPDDTSKTRVDLKFSFANCLDDDNAIFSHAGDGYTPEVRFRRFSDLDHLLDTRFPAVAGWRKDRAVFFQLLNGMRDRVFGEFNVTQQLSADYGEGQGKQWPFGWGTVHHACGTLRMPWKTHRAAGGFAQESVVDENLEVRGAPGLFVCDMSVMPISTAANPVRTLAALALRLSRHLG